MGGKTGGDCAHHEIGQLPVTNFGFAGGRWQLLRFANRKAKPLLLLENANGQQVKVALRQQGREATRSRRRRLQVSVIRIGAFG